MSVPWTLITAVPKTWAMLRQWLAPSLHSELQSARRGTWSLVGGPTLTVEPIVQDGQLGPQDIGDRLFIRGAVPASPYTFFLTLFNPGPRELVVDGMFLRVRSRQSPLVHHLMVSPAQGFQEDEVIIFHSIERQNSAFAGRRKGGVRQLGRVPYTDRGTVVIHPYGEQRFTVLVESLHHFIEFDLRVTFHLARRHRELIVGGSDSVRFQVSGSTGLEYANVWGAGALGSQRFALEASSRPELFHSGTMAIPIDDD